MEQMDHPSPLIIPSFATETSLFFSSPRPCFEFVEPDQVRMYPKVNNCSITRNNEYIFCSRDKNHNHGLKLPYKQNQSHLAQLIDIECLKSPLVQSNLEKDVLNGFSTVRVCILNLEMLGLLRLLFVQFLYLMFSCLKYYLREQLSI